MDGVRELYRPSTALMANAPAALAKYSSRISAGTDT